MPCRQPRGACTGRETVNRRLVFVVGAPRSGTTWVQLLLARHPAVVTSQETHLFERYLAKIHDVWTWEDSFEAERRIGLRPILSEAAFTGLCREFADGVFDAIGATRPEAEVLVEKTPGHVLSADWIRALYPEATFIHVVRDPRSVVASLVRAGRGWGQRWAPRGPATAARVWREHVEAGLALAGHTDRCVELRYEALHDTGSDALLPVVRAAGLEADAAWCREALEGCAIDRLRTGGAEVPWEGREPTGFYGPGRADGWMDELSRGKVRAVEHVAGDLMDRLGYPRAARVGGTPFRVRVLGLVERLQGALEWRLGRFGSRL